MITPLTKLIAENKWRPIAEAPKDGTIIRVRVFGDMEFNVSWQEGFMDEDENPCGQWVAAVEGVHPECWSGGGCWASNEDEVSSTHPTHFRPLPDDRLALVAEVLLEGMNKVLNRAMVHDHEGYEEIAKEYIQRATDVAKRNQHTDNSR